MICRGEKKRRRKRRKTFDFQRRRRVEKQKEDFFGEPKIDQLSEYNALLCLFES